MPVRRGLAWLFLLAAACGNAAPGFAMQAAIIQPPVAPSAAPATSSAAAADVDPATISVPSLAFSPDPLIEKDFDKYYYFHRDGTDFGTALADLRDCDGLARGLVVPYGYVQAPYPNTYTFAGAVGAGIANAMVMAIVIPAQIRANRRSNMRRCMNFKGYQRYGLPKPIWESFNFEEGLSRVPEAKRQAYLMQQAKVASGPRPSMPALGR